MITPASIRAKFPEFSALSDATIQNYIDDSNAYFEPTVWLTLQDQGQSYFVAAKLATYAVGTTPSSSQNIAPVASKGAGNLNIGYATTAPSPSDPDIMLYGSKYGQEYLALRNMVVSGITTTAPAVIQLPVWTC